MRLSDTTLPHHPHTHTYTLTHCRYAHGHKHDAANTSTETHTLNKDCHTSQAHMLLPIHIHTLDKACTPQDSHISTQNRHPQIHMLLSPTPRPQDTCKSGIHRHMSSDPEASPHMLAMTHRHNRTADINPSSSPNLKTPSPTVSPDTHTPANSNPTQRWLHAHLKHPPKTLVSRD